MTHVFAQIVHVDGPDIGDVVDYPAVDRSSRFGHVVKRPRLKMGEKAWTVALSDCFDEWREAVDLAPAVKMDREYTIGADVAGINPRSLGLPRIDLLVTHGDGSVSIVEAKVQPSITDLSRGLGQLLHYRVSIERLERKRVANLVLATPYLPPLLADTIANFKLPIKVLKATREMFSGLVPDHVR